MHELLRRKAAVEATRDKFAGRPFAWGTVDCAKVALWHVRNLGHSARVGLSRAGTYKSPLGARKALQRAGHASLAAAIDAAGLQRIPPAAALMGDVVIYPGGDDWEAVTIVAGHRAYLGFDAMDLGAGLQVMNDLRDLPLAAWRV